MAAVRAFRGRWVPVLALMFALMLVSIPLLGRAADVFVGAGSQISLRYRVPPVVVGAVLIGFGTSLPEALASVLAALDGSIDVAVGNIVGSNAANLTLVLGFAVLLCTVSFPPPVLRREVGLVVVTSLLFAVLLLDGHLGRFDGVVLTATLVVVLWLMLRAATHGDETLAAEVLEHTGATMGTGALWARLAAGAVGVVVGAYLLLWAALGIADRFGLSGGLVGVSLVALGTSLPEMVTSLQAARRGEGELIVGNLLGSNVFNVAFVGGVSAIAGPGRVDGGLAGPSTWLMCSVTIVVAALALRFRRVPRAAVPVLLAGYASVLVMAA